MNNFEDPLRNKKGGDKKGWKKGKDQRISAGFYIDWLYFGLVLKVDRPPFK